MAYDRKKAKEKLRERAKTTFDRSSGGSKIIKSGIEQWKCKEGKHKIDILPFLAGKKHPELAPGDPDYFYDVLIHFGVGAGDDGFLCLRMFKEDCPICEHRKALDVAGELDAELKKELRPKQYTLYNVICYDNDEEKKKGVQAWLVSSFFMQQKLKAIMQDESGEIINFYEPDKMEGKKISFERKGSGAGNTSFIGHKFFDRDYDISDKLLAQTHALDEIVIIPTYEEVERAFFGKKGKPEEEKESPEPDTEEETGKEPEITEEEIRSMSRKEMKQLIEDNNLGIDPNDFDTKEDLQDAIIKELEEDGGESVKDGVCPNKKGTFGKSFDAFDECPDCPQFDDCSEAHDELKDEEKKPDKKTGLKRRGSK